MDHMKPTIPPIFIWKVFSYMQDSFHSHSEGFTFSFACSTETLLSTFEGFFPSPVP